MTLIESAKLKIEDAFLKAEKYYGHSFSRPKNIIFKRTGTNAGHSNYGRRELMFHLEFMEREGSNFDSTYYHEVAHYIEDEKYGVSYSRSGRRIVHGRRWKFIMAYVMGYPPERCHSYDTSTVKTRQQAKHEYTCSCRSHFVTTTIHNKILRGRWRKCMRCQQRIIFKQFNAVVPKKPIDNIQAEIFKIQEQIRQLNAI